MTDVRRLPVRSTLNVPGSDIDRVREAVSFGPDLVWIDLEEPCTPLTEPMRETMRAEVGRFLAGLDDEAASEAQYFVRAQDMASGGFHLDVRAVLKPALAGIVLPKVEGAHDVVAADAILTSLEADVGREVPLALYPILETAQALRHVYEIASASPRVTYIGGAVSKFGDIVQALGYRWTASGHESSMFRSHALIELRAAGLDDGITGNWGGRTDDIDALRAFATKGRNLGYRGSMSAHGPHVAVLNEVFSPTPDEIAAWQRLAGGASAIPQRVDADAQQTERAASAFRHLAWAADLGLCPEPVGEGVRS